MRTLILNRDLRSLFGGVAAAAASGLLLGGVMQPNLRGATAAEGPQMLLAGGGPRSERSTGEAGMAAYRGKVPDYVIGTDWVRPRLQETPVEAAADDQAVAFTSVEAPEPVQVANVPWREEPREPPAYASVRGGWAYEANLPPPPPAPDDEDPADNGAG